MTEPSPLYRAIAQRAGSDQGREEWRAFLEGAGPKLLDARLDELVPVEAIDQLVQTMFDPGLLPAAVRLVSAAVRVVVVDQQKDDEPLGRHVPQAARARLDQLVGRAGLIDPEWVRFVFGEDAVERVLADALYRSIRDFSGIIPKLATKAMPMKMPGFGRAGALTEKIAGRLETLIEPEIRSFLAGGTKRALTRAADFAIENLEEPASVQMRRDFVRFIIDRAPAFHLRPLDDEAWDHIETAAVLIATHVAEQAEVQQRVRDVISGISEQHGDKTVRECLKLAGFESELPYDELADASFAAVSAAIQSDAGQRWLDALWDTVSGENDTPSG